MTSASAASPELQWAVICWPDWAQRQRTSRLELEKVSFLLLGDPGQLTHALYTAHYLTLNTTHCSKHKDKQLQLATEPDSKLEYVMVMFMTGSEIPLVKPNKMLYINIARLKR